MNPQKHEIYFDRNDFLTLLKRYQNQGINYPTPEQTILIAKAYFIQELFTQCISLLNNLNHNHSSKILFEKHTLLFKATYLLNPTDANSLIKIIDQFQQSIRSTPNQSLQNYHLNVFKQFRSFVTVQTPKFSNMTQKLKFNHQEILKLKQKGSQINSKQQQLVKQYKIQGFPCFLIDKNWRNKQQNFYKGHKNIFKSKDKKLKINLTEQQASYPPPIANFAIINHIYEIIPYQSKSQSHLNTILFPGSKYQVVNKNHWKFLQQLYGGIPLKRVYGVTTFQKSNEVTFDEAMLTRLVVSNDKKLEVIQTYSASVWLYSVFPNLLKRYGSGQLKYQKSLNNFQLIGYEKVFQPQNCQPLKFIKISNKNIHVLFPEDIQLQAKLFRTFDFEHFNIDESASQGLVGLTNDKLMCYMNSTLQCLSNTYSLSSYFMSNRHVQYLNFSKNNNLGSRAEITCAFVDIIKKIWTLYPKSERDAEINPSVFKETFAKRFEIFMEDSQEDAHQFLNFLLNCIHDDLNRNFKTSPNRTLKNPKDSSNFEDVRKTFFENYENYNTSVITDLLKGYTYSTLKCLTCQAKFYNFDMHLTIPLPIPASNSSISVSYLNSWNCEIESIRYNLYLENIDTVEDLIRVVNETRQKDYKKKKGKDFIQTRFYLLSLNKRTYKVQNHYYVETKITKLLNQNKKIFFYLYEVSKDNINPYEISNRKIDIQLDSFDDISRQQSKIKTKKLTLVEYTYDEERVGYPKLLYVDLDQPQDKLLTIIAQTISDQALKFSGGVATESQKVDCIEKIKIDKAKGKPYEYTLKVKLEKRINLYRQKERHEIIGQEKRAQFTLENCFNIYRQKDHILQEEGWVCANCKQVSECDKEQKIYNVGSHLIIVLKRFKEEEKVCTRIEYPVQNLNITQFIDAHYIKTHPNEKFIYDLYGVIVHRGSLNRGHYYSYCKNPITLKWYLFDDQLVREENDLDRIVDQNAYILFYKQKHVT